ncbi:MAG TPA: menaquinol-cytochrome C reductase, partial [Mycobacterium sp.]
MAGNPNLQVPDEAELAKMSREELGALGMALDGVELVEYGERYVAGSPADKRAERQVAKWFLLAALFAVLFVVGFIWWPAEYEPAYSDQQWVYALYTPIIGFTLGATILFFGLGVVALAKKVLPHEVAIQQRRIGMSDEVDRKTLAAQILDTGDKAGIKRRGILKGSLALAGGAL